jgi:hypothetical protein
MSQADDGELGQPLWDLVFAGFSLRALQNAKADWSIGQSPEDRLGVIGHCRILRDTIVNASLYECYTKKGRKLEDLIKDLEDRVCEDAHATLGGHTSRLRLLVADLHTAFQDECVKRTAFITLPEHHIQVEKLLHDPESWFGLTFGDVLDPPRSALDDFQEAARCFSVGFAASAIVFSLRATEDLLRQYYYQVKKLEVRENWGWRSMVKGLKKYSPPPSPTLLDRLDKLRKRRNEVMHPGQRDLDLWGHKAAAQTIEECREAVMEMVMDLENRQL